MCWQQCPLERPWLVLVVLGPWYEIQRDWDNFPSEVWRHRAPSLLSVLQFINFLPRQWLQQQTFTDFSLMWRALSWPGDVSAQYSPEMHHNTLGWSFRLGKGPKSPITFHVFNARLSKALLWEVWGWTQTLWGSHKAKRGKGDNWCSKHRHFLWSNGVLVGFLSSAASPWPENNLKCLWPCGQWLWPGMQSTQESLPLVLKVSLAFPVSVLNKQQLPERASQLNLF